jgi:small nuclear ribonucleoprotein (snRNP)-like protein
MARTLALLLLFPLFASAATPEEDEARIEVLVRAEKGGFVTTPAAAPAAVTAAPTPINPVAVAPTPAPASMPVPAQAPAPKTVAAATAAASDAGVPYASLKDHLGAKVRVTLKNGTERYAQLEAVDSQQIKLSLPNIEYTVQFSVPREQIARVDLR